MHFEILIADKQTTKTFSLAAELASEGLGGRCYKFGELPEYGPPTSSRHERTDEECLELASSIRVVLAELAERLAQALKDEAELNRALGRLMTKKGK